MTARFSGNERSIYIYSDGIKKPIPVYLSDILYCSKTVSITLGQTEGEYCHISIWETESEYPETFRAGSPSPR